MKARILALLKKQYPEYVSGEEISRMLGVSRTAVWKHICKLKDSGYWIESQSKMGYRLLNAPDKLYEQELVPLLQTNLIGQRFIYREAVESTNELAKELARQGAQDGTVVIAEEQTGGKGRLGRNWYSPPGQGIWFSIILRPPIAPVDIPKITIVCAVAVAKTIKDFTGVSAGIKWPNDILINNRKVAGILIEMNAETDKVNYLIVGIGINVNLDLKTIPPGLTGIITSLEEQKGGPVTRVGLLAELLNSLDVLYREFIEGNFTPILSVWKEMSVTLNRWVRIDSLNKIDEGIAFDIDNGGALLIMKKDGSMKRILSGEISISE